MNKKNWTSFWEVLRNSHGQSSAFRDFYLEMEIATQLNEQIGIKLSKQRPEVEL